MGNCNRETRATNHESLANFGHRNQLSIRTFNVKHGKECKNEMIKQVGVIIYKKRKDE